jgi:hypothetical protein
MMHPPPPRKKLVSQTNYKYSINDITAGVVPSEGSISGQPGRPPTGRSSGILSSSRKGLEKFLKVSLNERNIISDISQERSQDCVKLNQNHQDQIFTTNS